MRKEWNCLLINYNGRYIYNRQKNYTELELFLMRIQSNSISEIQTSTKSVFQMYRRIVIRHTPQLRGTQNGPRLGLATII